MRNLFYLVLCISLFSCKNAESGPIEEPSALTETVVADSTAVATEVSLPEKAAVSKAFNVAYDTKSLEEKEAKMTAASLSEAAWRDTACGQCGARCCVSCTSGGNPGQCSQTKFQNCNSCGHASAGHYSASQ